MFDFLGPNKHCSSDEQAATRKKEWELHFGNSCFKPSCSYYIFNERTSWCFGWSIESFQSNIIKFLYGKVNYKIFKSFKDHKINLSKIESRSSKRFENDYEFIIECTPTEPLSTALDKLREITQYMQVISRDYTENINSVPWFPHKIRDLDRFANHILSYGSELDADHPVSFLSYLVLLS